MPYHEIKCYKASGFVDCLANVVAFAKREPAAYWRASAGRDSWVKGVDIEAEMDRLVIYRSQRQGRMRGRVQRTLSRFGLTWSRAISTTRPMPYLSTG